jgi:hypothetical protein
MPAIRVYLAIESAHYAEALMRYLQVAGPDLQVIARNVAAVGRTLESVDVLTEIADTEPDVIVHHTDDEAPSAKLYSWILHEHPSLRIVHVNRDGDICGIRLRVTTRQVAAADQENGGTELLDRLLDAIRDSRDEIEVV